MILKHYVLYPYTENVLFFYVNVFCLSINSLPLSLLCNCTITYSPLSAFNLNYNEFEIEFEFIS